MPAFPFGQILPAFGHAVLLGVAVVEIAGDVRVVAGVPVVGLDLLDDAVDHVAEDAALTTAHVAVRLDPRARHTAPLLFAGGVDGQRVLVGTTLGSTTCKSAGQCRPTSHQSGGLEELAAAHLLIPYV